MHEDGTKRKEALSQTTPRLVLQICFSAFATKRDLGKCLVVAGCAQPMAVVHLVGLRVNRMWTLH